MMRSTLQDRSIWRYSSYSWNFHCAFDHFSSKISREDYFSFQPCIPLLIAEFVSNVFLSSKFDIQSRRRDKTAYRRKKNIRWYSPNVRRNKVFSCRTARNRYGTFRTYAFRRAVENFVHRFVVLSSRKSLLGRIQGDSDRFPSDKKFKRIHRMVFWEKCRYRFFFSSFSLTSRIYFISGRILS